MTPLAFLTVKTAESKVKASLYMRKAMIIEGDRDTPDQLLKKKLASKIKRYLPVNENFTTFVHSLRNPLNHIFKVLLDVFSWRIFNIKYFVCEVLWIHWFHATHCLDDVSDSGILEMVDTLCSLNATNI